MFEFDKNIQNSFLFRIFTLSKLPSLWFWGVKVSDFSNEKCAIRISYSWFTKNPFKSIYFSALSGAAELSTGLLVQKKVLEDGNVSMLVVKAESHFLKKATGTVTFICNEGNQVSEVFQTLQKSGDEATIELRSRGFNEGGLEVAYFTFTWAIKKR